MRPMTPEQREFAEQRHDLIKAFLKIRKLPEDDYYDVVVFGFLEAAQQYTERQDLQERFSFSTIAFRKMDDKLAEHWKSENRLKRKGDVCSLEAPLAGTENMTIADTVSSPGEDPGDQAITRMIYQEILTMATPKQRAAAEARVAGYTAREAAEHIGTTTSAINNRMHRVRTQARTAIAL